MNLIYNYCQSNNSESSQHAEGKKYGGLSLGFHWREKFCSYLPNVNYRAFSRAPPPIFASSPHFYSHKHFVMLTLAIKLSCFEYERTTFIISNMQPRAKTDKAILKD